eukprot:768678-Hanusia_phi.AAC.3
MTLVLAPQSCNPKLFVPNQILLDSKDFQVDPNSFGQTFATATLACSTGALNCIRSARLQSSSGLTNDLKQPVSCSFGIQGEMRLATLINATKCVIEVGLRLQRQAEQAYMRDTAQGF